MPLSNQPITQMQDADDILSAFVVLLNNAKDKSNHHISRSNRYRSFLEVSQYQERFMDRWSYRKPTRGTEWMPRVEGIEMRSIIDELVPLLVRSRPGITVEPEDLNSPIDLREFDGGELVGSYSDLPSDVVAEAATEILEGLRKHESRDILDRQIAEESLISGMSSVGFRIRQ